jgi:hypothetical protein
LYPYVFLQKKGENQSSPLPRKEPLFYGIPQFISRLELGDLGSGYLDAFVILASFAIPAMISAFVIPFHLLFSLNGV